MLPKKIHYCWFGGKKLPQEARRCIDSWKKYMPDYQIIEWNESNYDINSKCQYVKDAYAHKKWAFVSDYARFDILNEHGGLYFDTDVEVLRSMDDIIERGAFMGREPVRHGALVAPGLGLGVSPQHPIYRKILERYESDSFLNEDGTENLKTVVQRVSEILEECGFSQDKNPCEIQVVEGINIYPSEYFCPMGWDGIQEYTENTHTVHLYNASWLSDADRRRLQLNIKRGSAGKLKNYIIEKQLKILDILGK